MWYFIRLGSRYTCKYKNDLNKFARDKQSAYSVSPSVKAKGFFVFSS
jgi:hypothetical protein